jgi:hypothetical protein
MVTWWQHMASMMHLIDVQVEVRGLGAYSIFPVHIMGKMITLTSFLSC